MLRQRKDLKSFNIKVVTYNRAPISLSVDSSTETFQGDERQGPTSKTTLSSKAII